MESLTDDGQCTALHHTIRQSIHAQLVMTRVSSDTM